MFNIHYHKKRTLAGEETGVSFVCGLGWAAVGSQALGRAEVAVMLMAVTVLGAGGLNAGRASKQLLTSDARRHDDSFAPLIKVRLRLSPGFRLRLLETVGPELKEDPDDVGSPVLSLLPVLLDCVGAGELAAEPRGQ